MEINKTSSPVFLKTAVLLLVFNRPSTTKLVFEKLRQIKPLRLYIASDGAREGHESEKVRVEEVRKITTSIDWPCQVKTLFRDKNLGCKKGVSSAITWFFEYEIQGIILEDDCLPHLDFFTFCEDLLERHINDERVLTITGNNFQNGNWRGDASYYFSKYNHCWGWATWKRAWEHYQGGIPFWSEWKNSNEWLKHTDDKIERRYWHDIFEKVQANKIDSWAYPWTASVWYKDGLTATSNVNLVSNIGFGEDATHTKSKKSKISKLPTSKIGKIRYPNKIERNIEADIYTFENVFKSRSLRFPYILIFIPYRVLNYFFLNIKNFFKNFLKK